MSAEDYTYQKLIDFMRQSTIEGLLNPAVAKSRLNAVEQLSAELSDSEREDIRKINVEQLSSRFHKLHDSSIRPEVLELYVKRMNAALVDYLAWLDNPQSFFSIGGDTIRKDKRYQASEKEVSFEEKALEEITLSNVQKEANIFSIPLREDITVFVQNLPLDLSKVEAEKIGKVISALATEKSGDA
ncbi:hypothetical protein ACUR5C_04280 [Aliikangiella sp. IMCC44653]